MIANKQKRFRQLSGSSGNIGNTLISAARLPVDSLMRELNTTLSGLNDEQVELIRSVEGDNTTSYEKQVSIVHKLVVAFINPFTIVLLILACVSLWTDYVAVAPEDRDLTAVVIIVTMVTLSGLLRFFQEYRSDQAAARLQDMVQTTVLVERQSSGKQEIPVGDIVCGDIVHLAAGDMVPADIRIIQSKDLFVNQASLTGENEPQEKVFEPVSERVKNPLSCSNLAFLGSNVISGTAVGVVVATGERTIFGVMAKELVKPKVKTSFEKGVNSVSWILIRFMLCMVPVVFFINGISKGDWLESLLFGLSVAVGLTPEMLPMIVTTSLAKGAVNMSRRKTIVKSLHSIQNFGAMDILCTDKTGTITQNKVLLEYHLNTHGEEDERVLRYAFINSYYQTGLKNLMDVAILEHAGDSDIRDLCTRFDKIDEIPFDFNRRRMSVIVRDNMGKTQIVTKGAVEEMIRISSHTEYDGKVEPLTKELRKKILRITHSLNVDGMRVIAVSQRNVKTDEIAFSVNDERDMVLIGFLAFLDPPKDSAETAIRTLGEHGVTVKVLTGDNDAVTTCICRKVGMKDRDAILGEEIDQMSDRRLEEVAHTHNIFAKLSPSQKARIVAALRRRGHTVGFMGDGINDAVAMKESDVAISVDSAVDVARESADIILLEKDLMVLEDGIIEGRKTYANMVKYIKMTASSNFGNMFSVLIASAFLPFLPMLPLQLLVLNLIYDLSCISIPWDNVDPEYLGKPRKWDAGSIGKFMLMIGPTSSIFDITTYLLMFFVVCPSVCGGGWHEAGIDRALFIALFHTGWFVESLWSQTLVIHMIRTPKLPFIQSRASLPVCLVTCLGIAFGTILPLTALGRELDLTALPASYYFWLAITILLYMVVANAMKRVFIRKYGELL